MEQDSRGPFGQQSWSGYLSDGNYSPLNFWQDRPLPRPTQIQPLRFPGDGLDYRRPINYAETSNESFIDLTDDSVDAEQSAHPSNSSHVPSSRASRLPHYSRQIIDMTGDDISSSTPDVEFVSSRPRQRQIPPWHDNQADNDEIQVLNHMSSAPTSGVNGTFPRIMASRAAAAAAQRGISMYMQHLQNENARRRTEGRAEAGEGGGAGSNSSRRDYPSNFVLPNLNYISQAFDLQPDQDREQSSDDAIAPLIPAPEGFTMSPEEGDVLTCPNCDEELCTGDKPQKKQVWVIKACGHVRTPFIFECILNSCFENVEYMHFWKLANSAASIRFTVANVARVDSYRNARTL